MPKLLPKSFRFSPVLTALAVLIAAAMLFASNWQWERYHFKKELVATYEQNSAAAPLPFPVAGEADENFKGVLHKKVKLTGSYDFSHQVYVINRKHRSGPGYWLLTPYRLEGEDKAVMVSRGFIPFKDSAPESWKKYDFEENEILAVVQSTVRQKTFLSPKSSSQDESKELIRRWLYPDIERMASKLPYPVITPVFLQRLGAPPEGEFPAEAISVRVPPSTHFGYTIEWILLALFTLIVGFLVQAFPRRKRR